MGYIYKIVNSVNGKIYVGKTEKTLEDRFSCHIKASKNFDNCTSRSHLYEAMNKYGYENFSIQEIEFVENDEKLDDREIYWIKELGTTDADIGYNISHGGTGGKVWGEKENHNFYNIHRYGELNPFYGKHHSEETKRLIKEKKKLYFEKNGNQNKGKIRVRKGDIIKYIEKEDLGKYAELGWSHYEKKKPKNKVVNGHAVGWHQSNKQKETASKCHKNKVVSEETREKLRETCRNRSEDEKERIHKKYSASHVGKAWFSNGSEERQINKEDIQKYEDLGWQKGRLKKKISLHTSAVDA